MSATAQTITCPNCRQVLPANSTLCDFCRQPLMAGRPARVFSNAPYEGELPRKAKLRWQEKAYYVFACLIVLLGILHLMFGLVPPSSALTSNGDPPRTLLVFGVIELIMGLGLVAQNEWAQYLMKGYCALTLLGILIAFELSVAHLAQLAFILLATYVICYMDGK